MSWNPTNFKVFSRYHQSNLWKSQHLMSHNACKAKRMRLTHRAIQLQKRALLWCWARIPPVHRVWDCRHFLTNSFPIQKRDSKNISAYQNGLDIQNQYTDGDRHSLGSEIVKVGKQSGANLSGSGLELRVCSLASSFKLPIWDWNPLWQLFSIPVGRNSPDNTL